VQPVLVECLNATIKAHIAKCPSPHSVTLQELEENLYVDDWITGADSIEDVCNIFREGNETLEEGGFSLAKCSSNSSVVSEMLFREFETKHLEADSVKILGMKWLTLLDCFNFNGVQENSTQFCS
jgi:hypothetical protein